MLRATPGIAHAAPLSEEEMQSLVEPWLGKGALVAELPLPRLIDADVTPGTHVDLATLGAQLKAAAPDSSLDDHSRWIARLKGLADTVLILGIRNSASDCRRDGRGRVVRHARRS